MAIIAYNAYLRYQSLQLMVDMLENVSGSNSTSKRSAYSLKTYNDL